MAATVKSNANGRIAVDRSEMAYVPQRRDSYVPARNSRRGLISNITTAMLHPGEFFRAMPRGSHVLITAVLILALVGYAAVNIAPGATAESPTVPGDSGMPMPDMLPNPTFSGGPAEGPIDFSGMPVDGGFPPDGMGGGPIEAESPRDVTQTTVTVLTAAAGVLLGWGALAVILMIVPMLRGRAPQFSTGLHIAVWSALPLALMILVQVVYQALGGTIGEQMGVSALLGRWEGFTSLPETSQALLTSLTSQTTLFGLWSLILVYFGAREALRGSRIGALMAVGSWALLVVVAPVVAQTLL